MRPPSSGGSGIRLSAISTALMKMPAAPINASGMAKPLSGMASATLIRPAQISAISRLAPGPAAATQSMSCFGLRRLLKLTGTGFAQPNRMPAPPVSFEMIRMVNGTINVPIRSKCRIGFSVMRPSICAVRSPKRKAA